MSSDTERLKVGMSELALEITDLQINSLISYLNTLEETNRSFNLTRIPREEYVTLHVLDSLLALKALDTGKPLSILDVGTGAGFPGVPLATLLPHCSISLLDSTGKKVRFASEAAQACGLSNVVGIHARAEDLAKRSEHRVHYDVVVSRAVAAFPKLMEWLLPLTKRGGIALAMKGVGYEEEMHGSESLLRELGGSVERVFQIPLPGTDITRYLIVVRKKP
jgi:16S rRNA (guanine527-N7)-methyltransferase